MTDIYTSKPAAAVTGTAQGAAPALAAAQAVKASANPELNAALKAAEVTAIGQAKSLLKSRTIWALVVVALATLGQKVGVHIGDAQQSQIIDLITGVVQGGGLTAAALFRVVATQPLK